MKGTSCRIVKILSIVGCLKMLGKLYSILFMQLCLSNKFLLYLCCHFLNDKKVVMTLRGVLKIQLFWDVNFMLICCYTSEAFSRMAVGTLKESHKLVITFQPEFFVFIFFNMSRSKWEVFRGVT